MRLVIIVSFLVLQVCGSYQGAKMIFYLEKDFKGTNWYLHATKEQCYYFYESFKKKVMSIQFYTEEKALKLKLCSEFNCEGDAVFLNKSINDLNKIKFGKRAVSFTLVRGK